MAHRTGPCLMRAALVLAAALGAGCTSVHTPAPGQAVHLPALVPQAVVLPEPRESVSLPPRQMPPEAAPRTDSVDEKPMVVARPTPSTDKPKAIVAPPTPVASASPTRPAPAPAPAAAPMPPAPLDLDALKERLRETTAIGLMAKIDLRRQVDALVERFRAHHGGKPSAIDALRQSFNALVQKVLTLIREGDPALAAMLASSREAIWAVLEDPVKFNAVK